jgi:serine/threonine protein kinase
VDASDSKEYVLKRLKNPKRTDYFEREIQACMTLDHPNILKVVEHGLTPKGKPFLVTDYCEGGSLKNLPKLDGPGSGMRFFQQIIDANRQLIVSTTVTTTEGRLPLSLGIVLCGADLYVDGVFHGFLDSRCRRQIRHFEIQNLLFNGCAHVWIASFGAATVEDLEDGFMLLKARSEAFRKHGAVAPG